MSLHVFLWKERQARQFETFIFKTLSLFSGNLIVSSYLLQPGYIILYFSRLLGNSAISGPAKF